MKSALENGKKTQKITKSQKSLLGAWEQKHAEHFQQLKVFLNENCCDFFC